MRCAGPSPDARVVEPVLAVAGVHARWTRPLHLSRGWSPVLPRPRGGRARVPAPRPTAPERVDQAVALVRLGPLMDRGPGRADVVIGLIDGPVATDHADLAGARIRAIPGIAVGCAVDSPACVHGTFVAGILSARRGTAAPGLCPGCTLLVRPIFSAARPGAGGQPAASARDLADALVDCIDGGAHLVNVSAAMTRAPSAEERDLHAVLDHAARRGVVVVAAAGNQAAIGGSVITRHPWVLPVVGYDRVGRPMPASNLGTASGRRGLGAPAEGVRSLTPGGGSALSGGTSVAAPFVTGACALLLSAIPRVSGAEARRALLESPAAPRRSVVPPLLDASAALHLLETHVRGPRR